MGRACRALFLAAPLLLAGCSRAAPAKATAPEPRQAPPAKEDAVAIDGSYVCEFRMGSEELRGGCDIAEVAGALQLKMAVGAHSLEGAVTGTSYGFRLQGQFDDEPVEVDFMRQGGKSFAAVLQLADQRLGKIDMAPEAAGAGDQGSMGDRD